MTSSILGSELSRFPVGFQGPLCIGVENGMYL